MCRLHTEGIEHGCGHYIITRKVAKDDCRNKFCMNSETHPPGRCNSCGENCKRYFDPDASQHVTNRTGDYCVQCMYWFKGEGARRRQ
ncbi:hypothetical protein CPB83DRAFT_79529 [Crepidotus variabilis]|uniref:Uncharacterized protein n=1 Tax=Crepidotus variabilis TaxID=179855 RepID=A0A9P6EKV8_9AGAR|nr:hypothetical protein CPB83DRAFT_79529 [Crepidotus variabilis]